MFDALPTDDIPEKEDASPAQGPALIVLLKRRWESTKRLEKKLASVGRLRFFSPRCNTPRLGASAGLDSDGR